MNPEVCLRVLLSTTHVELWWASPSSVRPCCVTLGQFLFPLEARLFSVWTVGKLNFALTLYLSKGMADTMLSFLPLSLLPQAGRVTGTGLSPLHWAVGPVWPETSYPVSTGGGSPPFWLDLSLAYCRQGQDDLRGHPEPWPKAASEEKALDCHFVIVVNLDSVDFDAFVIYCKLNFTLYQSYKFKESNTSIRLAMKNSSSSPFHTILKLSHFFFFWYLPSYLLITSGIVTFWFFSFKHHLVGFSLWKMKI